MAREDEIEDRPGPSGRDKPAEGFVPPPANSSKFPLMFAGVAAALLLVCGVGGYGIYSAVQRIHSSAERMKFANNYKQIVLAAHGYHDAQGYFPVNSYDANGKPLLSWRVHLLPYMEQSQLYRQFKLNESWDSPDNRVLLDQMPRQFARSTSPSSAGRGHMTFVRAFATPGAVMEPMTPERLQRRRGRLRPGYGIDEIVDGTSGTIFFVEAGEAIEWTKPDDLTWDLGQPLPAGGATETRMIF